MKAKKHRERFSLTRPSYGADTSRWESLLSGGGITKINSVKANVGVGNSISTGSPSAPANSKPPALDRRISVSPMTAARGAKKLSKNRPEKGSHSSGAAASNNAAGPSNWAMLLKVGDSPNATIALNNGHTSHPPTGKSKKKGKKGKRPRSETNQVNGPPFTTPDFFGAQRSATANCPGPHSNGTISGHQSNHRPVAGSAHGAGKAGQKRKRSGANADSANINASSVSGGNTEIYSKRPRSNSLNHAFQAQQAAAVDLQGKGGDKGRRQANEGLRGARGRAAQPVTASEQARYVGLDCEMVGVGSGGRRSALARCCIVDWGGNVIYDKHVTPNERITDFRTFVSGVKAKHLKGGLRLRQCQEEVAAILDGKVLVGHALTNDFKALMLSHPLRMVRDTATYRPYQRSHGKAGAKLRPKALKVLAKEHLGRTIQTGEHHPAEDARAAMDLYKLARFEWEKSVSAASKMRRRRAVVDQQAP